MTKQEKAVIEAALKWAPTHDFWRCSLNVSDGLFQRGTKADDLCMEVKRLLLNRRKRIRKV